MTLAEDLVAVLRDAGLRVAVAESLTGGLVAADLVGVPGASAVVQGAVVAYQTELKQTVLGVDPALLAEHGPVHPDVAAQMATGVRAALRVGGDAAGVGLSTTGVAGPDAQGGRPPGTVYVAVSTGASVRVRRLDLVGDRAAVRHGAVAAVLGLALEVLAEDARPGPAPAG